MVKLYAKQHTTNVWIKVISTKFNHIKFQDRENEVANILNISAPSEIAKIKEASLIVHGRTLGVETFEDACKKLGISTEVPLFTGLDDTNIKRFKAEYKLITIIKALNEGWYPNWNNSSEYKYFPWFDMRDKVGFSCYGTYCSNTDTSVPSALLLKSSELATYCGLKFIDLYADLYI